MYISEQYIEGLDRIHEGYLFNNKNLLYKFDDWESGKTKVLLITGYSGSGKTTLGNKIAKEYNVEYNELDSDAIYNGGFDKSSKSKSQDEKIRKYVLDRLNNVNKQSVWEGCYVLTWLTPEEISKYSVIMVGSSLTKSALQGAKRRIESNKEYPDQKYSVLKDIYITTKFNTKELMKYYNKLWKYLKRLLRSKN